MFLRNTSVSLMGLLLSGLCLLFFASGRATAPPSNVRAVNYKKTQIDWDVTPEAEIVNFDCALGRHERDPSVIYTVKLKNISDQPRRFRLTTFLVGMDKAVAYSPPAKGKPPVLAPGAEASVKIPFMKVNEMPGKIQVNVKPMNVE
jgi:hypothetical protein